MTCRDVLCHVVSCHVQYLQLEVADSMHDRMQLVQKRAGNA